MSALSLLEIISVITAFHLLMLGLVLLSKRSIRRQSNRVLSLFMFSNALVMIHFLLSLTSSVELPNIFVFYYLLAPLMYIYVQSMCIKGFRLKPVYILHGAIFAFTLLYVSASMLFFTDSSEKWGYYEYIVS